MLFNMGHSVGGPAACPGIHCSFECQTADRRSSSISERVCMAVGGTITKHRTLKCKQCQRTHCNA